jgi:hypothetical protein
MKGSLKRVFESSLEQPLSWDEVVREAFANKQADTTKSWINPTEDTAIMSSLGANCVDNVRIKSLARLKNLSCWDGDYLNIGESDISEVLLKSHNSLEMVIYNPACTKGAILARPFFGVNDLEKKLEFPRLKILGIASRLYRSIPLDYGWITPNLETLLVVIHADSWWPWQAPEQRARLLESCPRLERVVICNPALPGKEKQTPLKSPMLDLETTLTNVVCVMLLPLRTHWSIIRLLWIAKRKPNANCSLSRFPKDLINHLVSFLCYGWRQIGDCCVAPVYDSRDLLSILKNQERDF